MDDIGAVGEVPELVFHLTHKNTLNVFFPGLSLEEMTPFAQTLDQPRIHVCTLRFAHTLAAASSVTGQTC